MIILLQLQTYVIYSQVLQTNVVLKKNEKVINQNKIIKNSFTIRERNPSNHAAKNKRTLQLWYHSKLRLSVGNIYLFM